MKTSVKPEDFKIRCSAIGNIMGGSAGLTDNQIKELSDLQARPKPTAIQQDKIAKLINKRDNIELSAGAKTCCEQWVRWEVFNKRNYFSGKYTENGTLVEGDGIAFLVVHGVLPFGAEKNTKRFCNDPDIEGEPDVLTDNTVTDLKSSWNLDTFPTFKDDIDSGYEWQLRGYMAITDKEYAQLAYTLMNTPEYIVEDEIYYKVKAYEKMNGGFISQEKANEIKENTYKIHTFDDMPAEHRIRLWNFKRDIEKEKQIRDTVAKCREYIAVLLDKIYNKTLFN